MPVALLERAVHAGALRACWAGDRFLLRGEDLDAFVRDDFHAAQVAARADRSAFAGSGRVAAVVNRVA